MQLHCIEVSSSQRLGSPGTQKKKFSWTAWPLKMKAPQSFEMTGTSHPMAQCHIVEDLNPHPYCYENFRSHKSVSGC